MASSSGSSADQPLSAYQQMLARKQGSVASPKKQNVTTTPTPASPSGDMSSISREDLMQLTMKMSKRIKAIEAQNLKLKTAYTKLNSFCEGAKQWITSDVVATPSTDTPNEPTDLMSELEKWKALFKYQQEERDKGIAEIQKAHVQFADDKERSILDLTRELREVKLNQVTGSEPSLLADTLREEITKLESDSSLARSAAANAEVKAKNADNVAVAAVTRCENAEAQLASTKALLHTSSEELKASQVEVSKYSDAMAKLEEKVVFLQMQQQSGKSVVAEVEELRAALVKAEGGRELMKRTLTDLRAKHKDLMASASASSLLLLEKESLIKRVQEESAILKSKLKTCEESLSQSQAVQESTELQELRDELTAKMALVNRLRREAEVTEKTHATRIAEIAAREANIDSLSQSLKDETCLRKKAEATAEIHQKMKIELEVRVNDIAVAHKAEVAELNRSKKDLSRVHKESIDDLQKNHEFELQQVRDDHNKKSSLARQLVAEKDQALKQVTREVEELRSEVESGGHSERKIMALATSQAQREAEVKASVNQRETELLRIHKSLKQKEEESSALSTEIKALHNEVNQLRRMSRRDGVNMEYLKNIVLQFICLRDDGQRRTLARVLETMLQFSPSEKQRVEDAYAGWGFEALWQFASPTKTIGPRS